MSRTVLSEWLQALVFAGAIVRTDGPHGPEYELTEAGQELASLVGALGTWGKRWLAREPANEDLDLEPLLVDMQRRVRFTALPKEPFVVRFEVRGYHKRFILLKKTEASLCHQNPGFPEPVCVRGPLAALVAWWRGDMGFLRARRMTETEWKRFVRDFKAEMNVPTARWPLDLLAALSHGTNLSIGCYCENEATATGLCFANY